MAAKERKRFGRKTDEKNRASFRQLLSYVTINPGQMAIIIVISLLGSLFTLAGPLLVGVVTRELEQGRVPQALAWGILAVVVIGALLEGLQHYLLQRMGEAIVLGTRSRLITKLMRLPIAEFDARRTGDLVSRVSSDTTMLRAVLTQGLIEAVGGTLTLIGASVAMLVLDPVLFGVTGLILFVSAALVVLLGGRVRKASAAAQKKVGDLSAAVERSITSVRTIRAAGATEREAGIVQREAAEAYDRGIDVASASALIVPVNGIAIQVALIGVLGFGGMRVATGELEVANLVSFVMFLFLLVMPLGLYFGAVTSVNSALGALGRIEEIMSLPDEDAGDAGDAGAADAGPAGADAEAVDADAGAGTGARPAGVNEVTASARPAAASPVSGASVVERAATGSFGTASTQTPAIAFENVSFRYPTSVVRAKANRAEAVKRLESMQRGSSRGFSSRDASEELFANESADAAIESPLILNEVSFEVPRGTRTALVGPSGAGKSTTLALIERFYDPEAGTIRVDGADIREIPRDELRSRIGYVEQDAPALAGTLRDNLTLSNPEASDDACANAIREVNLGHLIDRSPDGLETQIGEGGVMLSGGERQRLAIARTLLGGRPILLLDESTAALDGENEALMRDAIDQIAEGRSMIVIAHRLATVADADQIVVMDGGRVVARGTHKELLDLSPLYRRLAERQLLVGPEA